MEVVQKKVPLTQREVTVDVCEKESDVSTKPSMVRSHVLRKLKKRYAGPGW